MLVAGQELVKGAVIAVEADRAPVAGEFSCPAELPEGPGRPDVGQARLTARAVI